VTLFVARYFCYIVLMKRLLQFRSSRGEGGIRIKLKSLMDLHWIFKDFLMGAIDFPIKTAVLEYTCGVAFV
jgi:hypothetical protein